jgi:sec-independent protein translocase protein TatC
MSEAAVSSSVKEPERDAMPTMGFLEHLEELRRRIVYSLIAIIIGFFGCWFAAPRLVAIMQKPIIEVLRQSHQSEKLVYQHPVDPFNLYVKVAGVAGLFVVSPFVLYQLWLFIAPGLYRNEKRYVFPFMLSSVSLFLAGGYFAYHFVLPSALKVLIGFGSQFQAMITIEEYTSLFVTIIVGIGIVFEMPILVFFLALMGIVSAGWMWRNIRYSILGIFIIAAIVAPPDIVNMCIFAAPMLVLYMVSIAIAWFAHPTQRKKRAEKKAS